MRLTLTALALTASLAVTAGTGKPFGQIFSDSTLRVDYVTGRGDNGITILIDGQTKTPGWAGRRKHLDTEPVQGNASIVMTDAQTGDTIYRHNFSSLFLEWLTTPEAQTHPMAFEDSFVMPLPLRDADITMELRDNRHQTLATVTHRYRTDDELVARGPLSAHEHRYLHRGGDPENAIDIAILAEGYTEAEKESFYQSAQAAADEILSYEPFASYKDRLNFVAVMIPSRESGVSIPLEGKWADTPFGAHYSTFYSPRYLTVPKVKAMHRALAGIPYEHIMVVVNTDRYGGGGIFNSYHIAAARNERTLPVTVHEFGHSFAGLADEYFYEGEENPFYPTDIEPWEANITTLVDFGSKWADLVPPGTPVPTPRNDNPAVGVYEGGGYAAKGVYRPVVSCRMRDNDNPAFCPVCRRAIERVILFYTE